MLAIVGRRSQSTRGESRLPRRTKLRVVATLASVAALSSLPQPAAGASFTLGATTLRTCGDRASVADPVNVMFVGTAGRWQNSQRLVGRKREGHELRWRTVTLLAGGKQSILDASHRDGCFVQKGQSSSGVFHKHHTRYFEQSKPLFYSFATPYYVTVQDGHRDVKSAHCKGPGSQGPLDFNDRVPIKDNGFRDGGYNQAQREFLHAFADRKGRAYRSSARHIRFVQCQDEAPPRRYSVPWNGVLQSFYLNDHIECQGIAWHLVRRYLGECPSDS